MADTIYHAVNIFPGDGVKTQWDFQFDGVIPDASSGTAPYLFPADVKAQEVYTDETGDVAIDRSVELVGPATLKVLGAPIPVGHNVRIYRSTEVRYPLVDYRDRQVVTEADLDLQARQTLFAVMEVTDTANASKEVADRADSNALLAITTAEEAKLASESATQTADQALLVAQQSRDIASAADEKSEQALEAAELAEEHASNVETLAEQAQTAATAAAELAGQANTKADQALLTANGIDAKASEALLKATDADGKADTALSVANAIDAKATNALAVSGAAQDTANTALDTANGIDAKATQALSDSGTALTLANSFEARVTDLETDNAAITPFARTLLDDADAAAMRLTLGVVNGTSGQIDGLAVNVTSSTSVAIGNGAAWVPGLNKVVRLPAGVIYTPTRVASSFLHAYLTEVSGVPDVVFSTVEPVPYLGDARIMTGNSSMRYIGSCLCSAASNLFSQQHEVRTNRVVYLTANPGNVPFLIVAGAINNTQLTAHCRNFAPVTTTSPVLVISTGGAGFVLGTANQSSPLGGSNWLTICRANSTSTLQVSINLGDDQREFTYMNTGATTGTAVYGLAYFFGR